MNHERRGGLRTPTEAQVIIMHPGFGRITVKARDLSDGGVSVDMRNHISPPVGTIVDVIIKRHTGALNSEPVSMQVRHIQYDGTVGLAFV